MRHTRFISEYAHFKKEQPTFFNLFDNNQGILTERNSVRRAGIKHIIIPTQRNCIYCNEINVVICLQASHALIFYAVTTNLNKSYRLRITRPRLSRLHSPTVAPPCIASLPQIEY